MCKFESSQKDESRAQSDDSSKAAMSKPNGLLGQKSCRYLNQGRTFNDINEGRILNDLLISFS